MKKTVWFIACLIFVGSCSKKSTPYLPQSNGNINTITVVIPNNLWESSVGETIRSIFAMPAEGLPQQEPLFDLKQMPPEVFSGFAQSSRLVLWIGVYSEETFRMDTNRYASPQRMGVMTSTTQERLIQNIQNHASELISEFNEGEIKEKQRRVSKSLKKNIGTKHGLSIHLKMPSVYSTFKEAPGIVWYQKEIQKGSLNILAYELPNAKIDYSKKLLAQIITIRDSIGQSFIPGRSEGSYVITEAAYEPYIYKSSIAGFSAIETRGTWEVKSDFMAGPFLNYVIRDTLNNRQLVLEGFVFAPSLAKRDYIFEVDAILQSVQIDLKE